MRRRDDVMHKYPWWRVHPRLTVMLAVVVLLVAGGAVYLFWPRTLHVAKVYVTDGSNPFAENLSFVEGMIQRENARVRNSGKPYVSVAFAGPMVPRDDVDGLGPDAVRHDVEGAYLAQINWNKPSSGPGNVPQVQLLLANEGNQEADWSPVASDLEARVNGPDHLVAVAGLGRSTDNTRNFVHELSRQKIGIVAATITGDNMTQDIDEPGPVRGMVRVAPTNSDEAYAAIKFIDNDPRFHNGNTILRVQDQVRGDDYYATLGTAFTSALKSATKTFHLAPEITFDSSLDGASTVLASDASTVCADKADIVYYAGPTNVLQGFLAGLAARNCASGSDARSLTVITGAGFGRAQGQTLWHNGADANLVVLFTGLAHPDMWTTSKGAADGEIVTRFQDCANCFGTLFAQEPKGTLNDGDAIISHDAVLTVEMAIEKMVTQKSIMPQASQVAQELNHVKVPAASGWICSFDPQHNPVDKAIPILGIDQNGTISYQGVSSASSSGNPPDGCPS